MLPSVRKNTSLEQSSIADIGVNSLSTINCTDNITTEVPTQSKPPPNKIRLKSILENMVSELKGNTGNALNISPPHSVAVDSAQTQSSKSTLYHRLPSKYGEMWKETDESLNFLNNKVASDKMQLNAMLLKVGTAMKQPSFVLQRLEYRNRGSNCYVNPTELRVRMLKDLMIDITTRDVQLLFRKYDSEGVGILDYYVLLAQARLYWEHANRERSVTESIHAGSAQRSKQKELLLLRAESRARAKENRRLIQEEKEWVKKQQASPDRQEPPRVKSLSPLGAADIQSIMRKLAQFSHKYQLYLHERETDPHKESNNSYDNVRSIFDNYNKYSVEKITRAEFLNLLNNGIVNGSFHSANKPVNGFTVQEVEYLCTRYLYNICTSWEGKELPDSNIINISAFEKEFMELGIQYNNQSVPTVTPKSGDMKSVVNKPKPSSLRLSSDMHEVKSVVIHEHDELVEPKIGAKQKVADDRTPITNGLVYGTSTDKEFQDSFIQMFKDTVSAEINKSITLLNSTKKQSPKKNKKGKGNSVKLPTVAAEQEESPRSPPGTAPSQYEVLEVLLDAVRDPYEYPGDELINLEKIANIVEQG